MRILVADDHELFLQGLVTLLKMQSDVAEVFGVSTFAELSIALVAQRPDVLLLDLHLDDTTSAKIRELATTTRVIIVTASDDSDETLNAMRAGASGVVLKYAAVGTLMAAIRSVVAGGVWLPPVLQARMVAAPYGAVERRLTRREIQIARLVALGLRNAEAARRLFISEQTVKTHLAHILRKVGVRGRAELALHAVRVGLISLHERP